MHRPFPRQLPLHSFGTPTPSVMTAPLMARWPRASAARARAAEQEIGRGSAVAALGGGAADGHPSTSPRVPQRHMTSRQRSVKFPGSWSTRPRRPTPRPTARREHPAAQSVALDARGHSRQGGHDLCPSLTRLCHAERRGGNAAPSRVAGGGDWPAAQSDTHTVGSRPPPRRRARHRCVGEALAHLSRPVAAGGRGGRRVTDGATGVAWRAAPARRRHCFSARRVPCT